MPRALAVLQTTTLHNDTCHVEPGAKRVQREVGKSHCLLSLLIVSPQIVLRRALQSGPMWWLVEKHNEKHNENLVVHHCALSLSFFSLRTVALGGGVISLTALSVFSHCTV